MLLCFFQTINPAARGFTSDQLLILEQQLRMHVQLATQNFMQTYGHPEHYAHACKFRRFLVSSEISEKLEIKEMIPNG